LDIQPCDSNGSSSSRKQQRQQEAANNTATTTTTTTIIITTTRLAASTHQLHMVQGILGAHQLAVLHQLSLPTRHSAAAEVPHSIHHGLPAYVREHLCVHTMHSQHHMWGGRGAALGQG
jgi:hypothetical protein